jgi:hypothetical protein
MSLLHVNILCINFYDDTPLCYQITIICISFLHHPNTNYSHACASALVTSLLYKVVGHFAQEK